MVYRSPSPSTTSRTWHCVWLMPIVFLVFASVGMSIAGGDGHSDTACASDDNWKEHILTPSKNEQLSKDINGIYALSKERGFGKVYNAMKALAGKVKKEMGGGMEWRNQRLSPMELEQFAGNLKDLQLETEINVGNFYKTLVTLAEKWKQEIKKKVTQWTKTRDGDWRNERIGEGRKINRQVLKKMTFRIRTDSLPLIILSLHPCGEKADEYNEGDIEAYFKNIDDPIKAFVDLVLQWATMTEKGRTSGEFFDAIFWNVNLDVSNTVLLWLQK